MKNNSGIIVLLILGLLAINATANTYYVNANGTNPVSPYTDWSTAATNIQNAVDGASAGDLVLVTDGVYNASSYFVSYATNCVVINNATTVQSVNGPLLTIIQAYPAPGNTNGGTRCVYLGSGSTISGFTLMNGAAIGAAGIYCQSSSAIVTNCVITANSGVGGDLGTYNDCIISSNTSRGAYLDSSSSVVNSTICGNSGGGIYCTAASTVVSNCVITCNSSGSGGGGYSGSYYNCIISSNFSSAGGGGVLLPVYGTLSKVSTLNNCVIFDNSCEFFGGGVCSDGAILNNCTILNNSAQRYGGVDDESLGNTFLTNCIVYYNSELVNVGVADIAGTTNIYNCCTTNRGVNNVAGSPGFANIDAADFRLAPWSPCIDAGTNTAADSNTDLGGNPRIVNGTIDIGAYEYNSQFTNIVHYVVAKNTNAAPPFTSWLTAATNIQDAIDASASGDFVVVSNGVYSTGGRVIYGDATNRVAIDLPVTVQAFAGNVFTAIQGASSPGIRCVYMTNGATLIGFTLTNGYAGSGDYLTNESGGGVWCESSSATLINCAFTNNVAVNSGGGAYSGTLISCTLGNDRAPNGGGSCSSTLINCTLIKNDGYNYGGGASFGTLSNCTLLGNFTGTVRCYGGGACSNILYNCLLSSNQSYGGGGAYSCILSNCTLVGNTATNGGGANSCVLTNCTLTGNVASSGGGVTYGTLVNCTLNNNIAIVNGGGAASNTLYNCLLANNIATNDGGGSYYSTLTNCTLFGNLAAVNGGGAFGGTLNNCIISSNSASTLNGFGGGMCFGVASNSIFTNNSSYYGAGMASNIAYNCQIISNNASDGGGVEGGTLNYCFINNNTARNLGGGSDLSVLNFCTICNNRTIGNSGPGQGGGAFEGTLISCVISNNACRVSGGGAFSATLTNCLVIMNNAPTPAQGAGTSGCSLNGCTVAFNLGPVPVAGSGATNCIVYNNNGSYSGVVETFRNCCAFPLPAGVDIGTFTNAPLFVSTNDFHLQPNSPCINAGNNTSVSITTDFDGNPRIVGSTVDIGSYEYQTPTSVISYAYLQQFGLPADGSVDFADLDGTGSNVYQDWLAGLNPTNSVLTLAIQAQEFMTKTNTTVLWPLLSWQSVNGVPYLVQRSTNLTASFSTIQNNIVGQSGPISYTDTTAAVSGPYFYRVGIQ